jgi:hypothetical protein
MNVDDDAESPHVWSLKRCKRSANGVRRMRWLVKSDLSELKKLPASWTAINKLIKEAGLPPGRMCGRNRIWSEQEIDEWLLNRPTAKTFLRGRAKQLAEEARPPGIVKPGPSGATEGTGPNEAIQLAPSSIPDSMSAAQASSNGGGA